VREIVRRALEEDMPWGDVTSSAMIPPDVMTHGQVVVREEGVISGLEVAAAVFAEVDGAAATRSTLRRSDGDRVQRDDVVAEVEGPARAILSAERTALNLLQRMSGIATATARYVAAIEGTGATIVDTRKTAPGLRFLDKYAVRCGGGTNHRFSLSDAVLIKDNHLAASGLSAGNLAGRIREVRRIVPHTMKIEVEVDRLDQLDAALEGRADIILLDNMPPDVLRQAVEIIGGRALTEASGGITLDTVRDVALSGVDLISVGALTHSVRAMDISLEL
jgi:nicotinate-nucleotide pyrophosphorylase (carboxylating)